MKISRHNKYLLFEQEFLALLLIVVLGVTLSFKTKLLSNPLFYFITLLIGFALYFWMAYEEKIFSTGKKHNYFEYTTSYIIIAQAALVLSFFFIWKYSMENFLFITCLAISVIMYSIALSRIILYKAVFR
jgi:hypothetical protein